MGAKSVEAKGRIKEAAGDLTGNKAFERQGRADRAGGKVKEKIDRAIDKVNGVIGGRN